MIVFITNGKNSVFSISQFMHNLECTNAKTNRMPMQSGILHRLLSSAAFPWEFVGIVDLPESMHSF